MRSFAIFVAVILFVEAAPRHRLNARPDALPRAGGQTSPAHPLGSWSEKAPLGEQRTEAAVVFVNHRIYVIGGMARGQDSNVLNQEHDPATDRWRERAPMPRPLSHPGAAAMGGKICTTSTIRPRMLGSRPLRSPRHAAACRRCSIEASSSLTAASATRASRFVENEAYDLKAGRWSSLPPMPSGRHGIQAATDGQAVYIPGGAPACATAASETLLTFRIP
jgi:hypothetical protein